MSVDEAFCVALNESSAELGALCSQILKNSDNISTTQHDTDIFFILWAGALVFMMHLGFAMLSAGAVRIKNTKNILLCILIDACTCAVAWWLLGYGFAYGDSAGGFVGTSRFAGVGIGDEFAYQDWFFQFAFAATAATIVSGAVAERATFEAYMSYSVLLSIWVYPVVVHWVWGGGFLTAGPDGFLGVGAIDFAGDGPVHMVGGVAGAIGSRLIGPRIGRYDADGKLVDIPGHSSPLAFLGVFILWVGWFGFNAGSSLTIIGSGEIAERAVVNTMLSSATGALGSLFFRTAVWPGREWDISAALNGVLAGLVAITSGCPVVETWAALVIGLLAGIFYILASRFTIRVMRVDDPLDATPVHMFCGMLGLIMTGFFAKPEFVRRLNSDFQPEDEKIYSGVFYGGSGQLLASQIVEILVILCWVTLFIAPYFSFLNKMGWFRVSPDQEESGLDDSHHGGSAYPEIYAEDNIAKKNSNNFYELEKAIPEEKEGKKSTVDPDEEDHTLNKA
mmetsp:Transcript_6627/g.7600  ORF Transcript_6627/g.7600 Transcript_6627/m.7600 type:complete len:506 (+) Transcript_6627:138-1655(+)